MPQLGTLPCAQAIGAGVGGVTPPGILKPCEGAGWMGKWIGFEENQTCTPFIIIIF